jgi:hypothetical protein
MPIPRPIVEAIDQRPAISSPAKTKPRRSIRREDVEIHCRLVRVPVDQLLLRMGKTKFISSSSKVAESIISRLLSLPWIKWIKWTDDEEFSQGLIA